MADLTSEDGEWEVTIQEIGPVDVADLYDKGAVYIKYTISNTVSTLNVQGDFVIEISGSGWTETFSLFHFTFEGESVTNEVSLDNLPVPESGEEAEICFSIENLQVTSGL